MVLNNDYKSIMNELKTTIKDILIKEPKWIGRLVEYPQNQCVNLTQEQKDFFKELSTFEECDTEKCYEIVKILFLSRGIRSVNPVWYFIHYKRFKRDKIIIKIDEDNKIQVSLLNDLKINHQIQKIGTVQIYYLLINNYKICEALVDKDSEFIIKFNKFKELWKYLLFPRVEVCRNGKYIDIAYEFDDIIDNINIEINEVHHDKLKDRKRESEIYYKSKNRLVQYYVSKDNINSVLNIILFRLTKSIYNKNKYAGIALHAFIKDIIENLFTSVFFSELTKYCFENKLTLATFVKKCKKANIIIDETYFNIIEDDLPDDEEERKEELNKLFNNYQGINSKALLTEIGCHRYLMCLTKKQTKLSGKIKNMYIRYKQEYDKLIDEIMSDVDEQEEYVREYTSSKEYIQEMINKHYREN